MLAIVLAATAVVPAVEEVVGLALMCTVPEVQAAGTAATVATVVAQIVRTRLRRWAVQLTAQRRQQHSFEGPGVAEHPTTIVVVIHLVVTVVQVTC